MSNRAAAVAALIVFSEMGCAAALGKRRHRVHEGPVSRRPER